MLLTHKNYVGVKTGEDIWTVEETNHEEMEVRL